MCVGKKKQPLKHNAGETFTCIFRTIFSKNVLAHIF